MPNSYDTISIINDEIFSDAPVALFTLDSEGDIKIIKANNEFYSLVGYTPEELEEIFGNKFKNLLHPSEVDSFFDNAVQHERSDGAFTINARLLHSSGQYIWTQLSGKRKSSKSQHFYFLAVDITEHISLIEQLKKKQQDNDIMLSLVDDSFFDYDLLSGHIRFSKDFADRFGINEEVEQFPDSLIKMGLMAAENIGVFQNNIIELSSGIKEGELHMFLPDGKDLWYYMYYISFDDEIGIPLRCVGKLVDITEQKERIIRISRNAEIDRLTRLLNFNESQNRIKQYLDQCDEGELSALLLIDIDGFDLVNKKLGAQFGDKILLETAQKLKSLFRTTDILGRVGGDEFIVFMRDIKSENIVAVKAQAINDAIRQTINGTDGDYRISASLGIALCPEHGKHFDTLYRTAGASLYDSKKIGGDCYCIYNGESSRNISSSISLLQETEGFWEHYAKDFIYNIFHMLYQTEDLNATLNSILKMIGTRFNCDRCFILQKNDDGSMSKTHDWCANDARGKVNELAHLTVDEYEPLLKLYDKNGIFCCSNVQGLDSDLLKLSGSAIKSAMQCAFNDKGIIHGFIGIDDCKTQRRWTNEEIATLNYISKIIYLHLYKNKFAL